MSRRNDKRSRLVEAADKLFHEQGVNTTTLANIAQLADVPLGNVYYYFKSKDSIVLAVVEHRRRILSQQFEEFNAMPDAMSRLRSMIQHMVLGGERTAAFGDALGSLCQELGKQGGKIAESTSDLMQDIIKWCENQFTAIGKGDNARTLALSLVSSLQGISLLTLTFKDPNFMDEQSKYLLNWLETV